MARRSKTWAIREDYRPLLKKIKKLFPTVLGHVRTHRIFLVGFQHRHSDHMARISKNRYPWCMAIPDYDYIIEFWSTRFDEKSKAYKLFVMLHELRHVPEGGFDKENIRTYRKLVHHDVEDFSDMLESYGLDRQHVDKIYKGEKHFLKLGKIQRFPRTVKVG